MYKVRFFVSRKNVILPLTSFPIKEDVSIVFHPFPLPYHKNGFDSTQAGIVMASKADFVTVANALFNGQGAFQTDATVNKSQAEVFETIFAPIAESVGVDKSYFLEHMTNEDPFNEQARVAWKFGCAHTVSGTPTFAANGIVSDALASYKLADWEKWLTGGGQA